MTDPLAALTNALRVSADPAALAGAGPTLPNQFKLPDVDQVDAGQNLPGGCGLGGLQQGDAIISLSQCVLSGVATFQQGAVTATTIPLTFPLLSFTSRFLAVQGCQAPTPAASYRGGLAGSCLNVGLVVTYTTSLSPLKVAVTALRATVPGVSLTASPDGLTPADRMYVFVNRLLNAPLVTANLCAQITSFVEGPTLTTAINQYLSGLL